ncbi:TlpA family protein disulfide reductase [Marinigracilibium pacificum]|uniref:TlpA family protein disulfide reductase n=1 Tax=Marinigracilibium pacificum TaxID=2729599 RepID=A0A848IYW7_9BACT|nr:TlpA disulfide reductase family protein [Marinigracilibium pacificum]NMM47414.1 TlpA family protein disulfide reductase [Marinigracilibium pacificum]
MRIIIFLFLFASITSCNNPEKATIQIKVKEEAVNDSIFIKELITERILAKACYCDTVLNINIPYNYYQLFSVSSSHTENTLVSALKNGVNKIYQLDNQEFRSINSPIDSLSEYLWKSTNEMFGTHGELIFNSSTPEQVKSLFDSLIVARDGIIIQYNHQIDKDGINLLKNQNRFRAYSFLYYYGRNLKNIEPNSEFYSFQNSIDHESIYNISGPNNSIYKFEIEYLREHGEIKDISRFLDYIDHRTVSSLVRDLYRVIYLKGIVESPSYWKKHQTLLDKPGFDEMIARESGNYYFSLLQNTNESISLTKKGKPAYNFKAYDQNNNQIMLSDFKGKYVFIDTWASWCGPCISQRPNLIKMAEEMKGKNIVFLLASVDKNENKWKKYITTKDNPENVIDVKIPADDIDNFRDQFFIPSIPRYILIGPDGKIINPDLPSPSNSLKEKLTILI